METRTRQKQAIVTTVLAAAIVTRMGGQANWRLALTFLELSSGVA